MKARGITLFELLVVLGLFSLFTVYLTAVVMPMQRNSLRIEGFGLRQQVAQAIAEDVAQAMAGALPDGSFACTEVAGGVKITFHLPAMDERGVRQVRIGPQTLQEPAAPGRIVREEIEQPSGARRERVYGQSERGAWSYELQVQFWPSARNADRVERRWSHSRLPEMALVRVLVRETSAMFKGAAEASGIAVARLYNAGVNR